MITAIFATGVAGILIYVIVKYLNILWLFSKHGEEGKDFIIYLPKWYTLLASVKSFDSSDYVSKEHVDYKVKKGMERGEAELEEWIIMLEMELPKHEGNFITNYCIVENGKVVIVKPLDEYFEYMVGYLKGCRIAKQILKEINDED